MIAVGWPTKRDRRSASTLPCGRGRRTGSPMHCETWTRGRGRCRSRRVLSADRVGRPRRWRRLLRPGPTSATSSGRSQGSSRPGTSKSGGGSCANMSAARWTVGRCRPIDFLQERQAHNTLISGHHKAEESPWAKWSCTARCRWTASSRTRTTSPDRCSTGCPTVMSRWTRAVR